MSGEGEGKGGGGGSRVEGGGLLWEKGGGGRQGEEGGGGLGGGRFSGVEFAEGYAPYMGWGSGRRGVREGSHIWVFTLLGDWLACKEYTYIFLF